MFADPGRWPFALARRGRLGQAVRCEGESGGGVEARELQESAVFSLCAIFGATTQLHRVIEATSLSMLGQLG